MLMHWCFIIATEGEEADETGAPVGKPYVAVDSVDAGTGDLVLVAAGSSAGASRRRARRARR